MKKTYQSLITALVPRTWSGIVLLLSLLMPLSTFAQMITFSGPSNSSSEDFGSVYVGFNSSPKTLSFTGTSLAVSSVITVNLGSGTNNNNRFFVSTDGGASYNRGTVTLGTTDASGNISGNILVRFQPDFVRSYSKVTSVVGSDADGGIVPSNSITFTGIGLATDPQLTVSPGSYTFGNQLVNTSSASRTIDLSALFLTGDVTVTAPAGFEVSTDNVTFSPSLTVPRATAVNGTQVYVRFSPTVEQLYSGDVEFASQGATTRTVNVSGTGIPSGPFITVNPANLNFGTVSATGSAQTLSFTVSAVNLQSDLVLTGSSNVIRFRDASAGGSFVNGPITITPSGTGTVSNRTIEVQLTGPIPAGAFSGSITASSTNAIDRVVTISANSTGGESVLNVSGTLNQFSTVPGVASAVQSYQLSGTNLLQDVTVTAPQYFQVSLDPAFAGITGTGNTIVIARNASGEVVQQPVYVRFLPPSALSTTSLILNSSNPAVAQGIQVAGTSEPSIQIQNPFVEVRNIVINTTSASQALNVSAQRVLSPITITKQVSGNPLNPSSTPQFQLSTDNVNFSNSVTLVPDGVTYTIAQPVYVRYAPTYLGSAQSTLRFQSSDFSVKTAQNFDNNGLVSGRSIDTEPTERSVATVTRSNTTATVSFNLPANYAQLGFGEGRLIVASENSTLPANSQPIDGNSYQTGNQTYGQGPQIAPGYFFVYSGANQTVTIDGLDIRKTYYFYTFEFNNIDNNFNVAVQGAENYLSPPVPNTIPGIIAPSPLPVTLVSFSAKAKGNQVVLNWVTASELNNKGFEVQRSRDGRSFETILTRDGQGTTNATTTYNEVDKKPVNGLAYYRLKQVDLDGSSSFSATVTINFLNSGEVTMYPNPVQDQLTIDIAGSAEGVTAVITDMTGRLISTRKIGTDSKLDMTNLQAGTYLVTVGEGDAKVTRRIVKK